MQNNNQTDADTDTTQHIENKKRQTDNKGTHRQTQYRL